VAAAASTCKAVPINLAARVPLSGKIVQCLASFFKDWLRPFATLLFSRQDQQAQQLLRARGAE
jgi:hypothetical protein